MTVQLSPLQDHRIWEPVMPAHYFGAHNFNTNGWAILKLQKRETIHSFTHSLTDFLIETFLEYLICGRNQSS